MIKTPLQIFKEREQKECCLNCSKLIVIQTNNGHINFCGYCEKIANTNRRSMMKMSNDLISRSAGTIERI